MSKTIVWLGAMLICNAVWAGPDADKIAAAITGKHQMDQMQGCDRIAFEFEGCEAWLVEPHSPAPDGRWVWCMEWPTAFQDRTGVKALLDQGYRWATFNPAHIGLLDPARQHLAAGNISDAMVEKRQRFQQFLVQTLGLNPKCGLIGMSWGGFYSVRYASIHPECVNAIYLDAPLLDFTSLGGYKGPSPEQGGIWRELVQYYPFATRDYDGTNDPFQSVNRAEPLARAKIPILALYGGSDPVVNPAKNIERFAPTFEKAGGELYLEKRGPFGHHPHGVEPNEVNRIVNFFNRQFNRR